MKTSIVVIDTDDDLVDINLVFDPPNPWGQLTRRAFLRPYPTHCSHALLRRPTCWRRS